MNSAMHDLQMGILRPAYLTAADYPWLGRLLGEVERFIGQRRGVLLRRLAEPMPFEAPKPKLAAAVAQIVKEVETAPIGEPRPSELRAALFQTAAALRRGGGVEHELPPFGTAAFRASVVASGARRLEAIDGDVRQILLQRLYADIPSERIIAPLPAWLTPASLALAVNGMMVARHLKRADAVTIELRGEARRVVRQAKLRGLLCTVKRTALGVQLSISGPLAVIHRTTYYGRALAELVPFLAWCPAFSMLAHCVGRNNPYRLQVQSGDPLPPAPSQPSYDSLLERRFAQAFGKATDAWDLIREPEPVAAPACDGGMRLVFPDFAAVQRSNPLNRWLIEIVGFWTPSYLASKLDGLRALGSDKLVLCVDERLASEPADFQDFRALVRFKGRVPVRKLLDIIEDASGNG